MQDLLNAFQASSQTGAASIFATWPPVHEDDIDWHYVTGDAHPWSQRIRLKSCYRIAIIAIGRNLKFSERLKTGIGYFKGMLITLDLSQNYQVKCELRG